MTKTKYMGEPKGMNYTHTPPPAIITTISKLSSYPRILCPSSLYTKVKRKNKNINPR